MAATARPSLRDLAAPPNLVTLLRVALIPVVLVLMSRGARLPAAALVLVMFATDGLDGYLARRLGRVTELGKILDPAADKVAVAAVLVHLTIAGEFPVWALLAVAVRDVGIAVGGAFVLRRSGVVPAALLPGKIALVVLAAMVIVFVADLKAAEPAALWCGMFAVAASGLFYALTTRKISGTSPADPESMVDDAGGQP